MGVLEGVGEVLVDGLTKPKGLVIGIGVALLAPVALPVLRPVAKQVIKGGIVITDKVKEFFAEAGERWSDLVAEARADLTKTAAETVTAVDEEAVISVS